MKKHWVYIFGVVTLLSCSKKNDNVVTPISLQDFPQQIVLDEEGDGDFEDEDKVEIEITLTDRVDTKGEELGGKIVPLSQNATISFEINDLKGFENAADYIVEGKAYYEIDDCTTSEDEDLDLDFTFDVATGKGSVTFPKDVEAIIIEFEVNPDVMDNDEMDEDDRGFTFQLTGVSGTAEKVVVNTDQKFEYEVLDDEKVFNKWEMDLDDAEAFARFKKLFGILNKDISELSIEEVDEIGFEFGYDKLEIKITLVETEEVEECGEIEEVNKEIEIELEYDEITKDDTSGNLEVEIEMELDNGFIKTGKYKGAFEIVEDMLTLTLTGEYDDEETNEISLQLFK